MNIPSNITLLEFEEVSSTNSLALEKAASGVECPSWFTALRQTSGRGRGHKKWVSQEGNLFASLLTRQHGALAKVTEIGFLSALAAYDAICDTCPNSASSLALKWPNDILLSHKKIAGILLETEKAPDPDSWFLVAGFGVNLLAHPQQTDWPATHLATEGWNVTRTEMLNALMINMAKWFSSWEREGFSVIREAWIERGPELGAAMTVKHHNTELSGSYGGLDNDGGLLLIRNSGEMTKIITGIISG